MTFDSLKTNSICPRSEYIWGTTKAGKTFKSTFVSQSGEKPKRANFSLLLVLPFFLALPFSSLPHHLVSFE
jgi:hypothetical protein